MDKKTESDFAREWIGPIELNDLPKYSPWPLRLLGLSDFTDRQRNEDYVLKEYGGKWGGIHKNLKENELANLEEAFNCVMNSYYKSDMLFHIDENIYYSKDSLAIKELVNKKIVEVSNNHMTSSDTIVELGSGWGRNLFYFLLKKLCHRVIGGEYTKEGRLVSEFISEKFKLPAEFFHFDYYNPHEQFMQKLAGTVVFTHNSVEQIRHIPEETIQSLIESKPRVVIHFEPVYEYCDKNTLLHYLWKRYTLMNDYNRNLLTVLKKFESSGKLRIIDEKVHTIGLNAFNPGSFIVWEPSG